MVEEINALDLLKEELTTEEVHLKVNAIHRMKTVILSIGSGETTQQLIPYLDTLVKEQDDEVLFAIAEELGEVWQLQNDKTLFLPLLEKLAKQDETVVREQAIKSLTVISKSLSDQEMQNVFCPLVIRLAQAEFFTGRVSSCGLFYHAYPRSNSNKERLRKKFMELCQEDTPMIRRACAARLGEFSTQLEKQHVIQELLPIFRQLSQDDQDAIRVLCLEALIPLAGHLTKEENRVHTLGSLLNAGEDKSWKVRLCFARNFAKFAEAFGKDITDNNLIQTFNLLLNDSEPEVKNAAITSLSKSLTNLSTEKICNILLPTLQNNYAEAQTQFKSGVALALCEFAPIVGKDYCIQRVIPILENLMKDDSSEVRLNVAQNMSKLASVVGGEILTPSMTTNLTNLTKDAQWRVRMATVELIGAFSLEFGKDVFVSKIESIFMQYLTNTAASVREMGIEKAAEMAKKFGADWVRDTFIGKVVECYQLEQQGYNYRMCSLRSLAAVMPVLNKDEITAKIVPTFLNACGDSVPNVQFCVAKIIHKNKSMFDPSVFNAQIVPKLQNLQQHADRDVAYFAYVALQ